MTKIIQLGELAADPAPVADSILIYSKEVSGVTQLFGRASDGVITQLTPAGDGVFVTAGSNTAATLAISPDGSRLYGGDQINSNIKALLTASNSLISTIVTGQPGSMVVTPDGAFVYAIMSGLDVWIIETTGNTVYGVIPTVGGLVDLIMAPDGAYVYVLDSLNAQVHVIDTSINAIVASPATGTSPYAFAITPDGSFVCVANNGSDDVTVIETATFTVLTTVTLTTVGPLSVVAAPGSAHVYVGTSDGFITKIVTATWTIVGAPLALVPAVGPSLMQINTVNTRLYASSTNFLQVIDLGTFTAIAQTPDASPASITNFLLSPNDTRLYIPYDDSQLLVIDTSNPTVTLATVPVGDNTIDMVATPDSAKIYLTNGDETLRMILAVDNSVTLVQAAVGPVNTLSFPRAIVTDLGGGVAQIDIGATQYAFVFRPGFTNEANVYADWSLLMGAMGAVKGPKLLQFDDQFDPIVIPAGTWDMTDTVWEGIDQNFGGDTPPTTVTFDDGAEVEGLRTVRGLYLICAGATAINDLNGSDVFTFEDYAVMGGDTNPIIDLSNLDEKSNVILSIRHGAQVRSQDPPITGLSESVTVDVDSMSLFDGQTVIGTGTVRITKSTLNSDTVALQDLAGGVIVTNRLGGFNLQANSLSQLFPGIVNYWDINGAQNSNLTPAAWNPGGVFIVKHAGTSGTVTINTSGAETIDGAATKVLNPGGSVIMISDGVSNYMIVGEKV